MVRKLIDRNEALEMKEDEMVIFPLLVVSCNSTHTSAFSETTVNIRSGETFGVWTEMNLIEQICPVSTQELRKLQKSQ
jgi:L-amino acid N-acyltransferase YncA